MVDTVKISELLSVVSPDGTTVVPCVQSGITKKQSNNQTLTGGGAITTVADTDDIDLTKTGQQISGVLTTTGVTGGTYRIPGNLEFDDKGRALGVEEITSLLTWRGVNVSGAKILQPGDGLIGNTVATTDFQISSTPGTYAAGDVIGCAGGQAPGFNLTVPSGVTVFDEGKQYTGPVVIPSTTANDNLVLLCTKADQVFVKLSDNNGVATNVRYAANNGNNANAGTAKNPYQTLAYALSAITTATANNPFVVILPDGYYTESGQISLKPNISIFALNPLCTIANSLAIQADATTWNALSGIGRCSANLTFTDNVNIDLSGMGASGAAYLDLSGCKIQGNFAANGNAQDSANLYYDGLQVTGTTTITNFTSVYGYNAIYASAVKYGGTSAALSAMTVKEYNPSYLDTLTGQSGAAETLNLNIFLFGASYSGAITADGNKPQFYFDPQSYNTDVVLTNGAPAPITPSLAQTRAYTAQQYFAAADLTDAATVSWDLNTAQVARLLLTNGVGATRTLDAPTNPKIGSTYTLIAYESTSGGEQIEFNPIYKFIGNVAPVMPTTPEAFVVFNFIYDGTYMIGSWSPGYVP